MPSNLMDAIRQGMQQPTQPAASDTLSSTAQTQSLLNTKATGKAQPDGSAQPATSNIGEQVAKQQTQLAGQQLSQQGAMKGNELGAAAEQQTIEQNQQEQAQTQQQKQAQTNLLNQANSILTSFSQGQQTQDLAKQKAQADQLGFTLRLSNSKYVDNLQREGKKARLDSALSFSEALQRSIFADEESLLHSNLDFRTAMRADDRTFETMMGKMSTDYAIEIAHAQASQANQQAQWSGIGTVVNAGAAAGTKYFTGSEGPGGPVLDETSEEGPTAPLTTAGQARIPGDYTNG